MKALLIFLSCCCCTGLTAFAQPAGFDKKLADSLGADAYGMKSYVLVMLKSGTGNPAKETVDSLFRGHMENIGRLAKEGKLIVAGPLKKNDKNYRGIFILNVKTVEEATALLQTDPAIKRGVLVAESYGWYGSAALPMYLPYHNAIEQQSH
ncbi:YciI family protein [Flavihumibacter petaseus]|uniref:YCII-related domain-containing protein n=1 Tax=Flavihumibacter petaseus NBRC 106054 TaxID=1220578 RepID=A0A0E9N6D0_9BACT|nr:YciI family protein [Flavihumibacter petaseus]GAO44895.1 hypothetical protein FPE01S_04_01380 [Flavihumibacter petaseus NBRC 106054]